MKSSFRTIDQPGTGLYKEKGSKFIGYAFPVSSADDIEEQLQYLRKKEHAARHHCFAWKLGLADDQIRANDDGEPANSAGKPILGQIEKRELTDVLVVVVRYFGGTKLGVGGLINAYRTAAGLALDDSNVVTNVFMQHYELTFGYDQMGDVMLLIRTNNLEAYDQEFEMNCKMKLKVGLEQSEQVADQFALVPGVTIQSLGVY